MKLFGNPTSPFVRKVAVAIAELGLADRVERVETNPRDEASGFWSRNPLAKIPAFDTGDGQVLFDSRVILAWLDEAHGGGRLTGSGGRRWRVLTLAALADGVMDAGVLARQETMRPDGERSPAALAKQLAVAARGLDRLDASVGEFSPEVDLAAIGAGCAVGWLGFRHAHIDWLQGRPRLAEWYRRFAARPSMVTTAPG